MSSPLSLNQSDSSCILTDTGAAFLTGVPLALFYVGCGIPIAWLADRSNRRNIVAAALILWSGFTALCGVALNYWQFLISRIGAGVGEAGATPPSTVDRVRLLSPGAASHGAQRLRSGRTHRRLARRGRRGRRRAGATAGAARFWRSAYRACCSACSSFSPSASLRAGGSTPRLGAGKASFSKPLAFLWRQRAAFHVIMASGVCSLWGWGLAWWTPTFLLRTYGLSVAQAGAITGHIHLLGGIAATVVAAWLMSRPSMVDPKSRPARARLGHWSRHHSLDHRVLDALARTRAVHVLGYLPAIYFFIGPCMALGAESGAEPSCARPSRPGRCWSATCSI